MVMRPLSRAIAGIPRPYLDDRSKRLIFPALAGTFFWQRILSRHRLHAPKAVQLAHGGLVFCVRVFTGRRAHTDRNSSCVCEWCQVVPSGAQERTRTSTPRGAST